LLQKQKEIIFSGFLVYAGMFDFFKNKGASVCNSLVFPKNCPHVKNLLALRGDLKAVYL
jgi:hypothetical protein